MLLPGLLLKSCPASFLIHSRTRSTTHSELGPPAPIINQESASQANLVETFSQLKSPSSKMSLASVELTSTQPAQLDPGNEGKLGTVGTTICLCQLPDWIGWDCSPIPTALPSPLWWMVARAMKLYKPFLGEEFCQGFHHSKEESNRYSLIPLELSR